MEIVGKLVGTRCSRDVREMFARCSRDVREHSRTSREHLANISRTFGSHPFSHHFNWFPSNFPTISTNSLIISNNYPNVHTISHQFSPTVSQGEGERGRDREGAEGRGGYGGICRLFTSDAADEAESLSIGSRRYSICAYSTSSLLLLLPFNRY